MAPTQGTTAVKKASAPKKPKSATSHPRYIEMITEALVALKERTGSSHYAIAKHIEEQQKIKSLPLNFKKLLSVQLKKLVASGKLVQVKKSFKLPPVVAKKSPASGDSKPKPKSKGSPVKVKKVKVVAKPKAAKSPAKKAAKSPAKKVAVVAKGKKAVTGKAKRPRSIKSPAKKAPVAKKARK